MKKNILYTSVAFFALCFFVSAVSEEDKKLYLALDTSNIVFVDRDNKDLLNCLCKCLEVGQFSCRYDTEAKGTSPSCRNLSNGDCICQAYGCFRKPVPTSGTCYNKCNTNYGNGSGTQQRTSTVAIHSRNKNKFTHCQDLAYTELYKRTPPNRNVSKTYIKSALRNKNYKLAYNFKVGTEHVGRVKPAYKEGDILIFGTSGPPNEGNAPHYAVYTDGYIYDITYFSSIGQGRINKRSDINYYFRKRLITMPNGNRRYSPVIYKYCKIYRRP